MRVPSLWLRRSAFIGRIQAVIALDCLPLPLVTLHALSVPAKYWLVPRDSRGLTVAQPLE